MERVAIWGLGKSGKEVFELVKKSDKHEVTLIADGDVTKQGTFYEEVPIITPNELINLVHGGFVDTLVFCFNNQWLWEITERFRYCKIKTYLVPRYRMEAGEVIDAWNKLILFDCSRPRLQILEFHIADHCNMKCKGCIQFSNMIDTPAFSKYEDIINDIRRLKEIFGGIDWIKILGGEPLLNKEAGRYVKGIRELCPEALLEISTNGVLINEDCGELFQIMRENYCRFHISLYRAFEKRLPEVERLLQKEKVMYIVNYSKGMFTKSLSPVGKYDMAKSFAVCPARTYHHMRDGKIAVCSRPFYVGVGNEKFGINIPTDQGKYDIHDKDIEPWELFRKLNSPYENCRYCGKAVDYVWDRADSRNAKYEDWYIE